MKTITFYSYKGGVGRTLALSNIAFYLSRLGFNVCLMDFDLEAPGLPYKFPRYIRTEDIKGGLVDYMDFFLQNDEFPPSLKDFSNEILASGKSVGSIRLIPAGNTLTTTYWKKMSSINWNSLFYGNNDSASEGIPFFLELKERIEKEFKPDFLLIDSRTGITEMSGICTSILPDKVVFFIVNNKENKEGARQILGGLRQVKRMGDREPIKIIFVLSRIPLSVDKKEEVLEKKILRDILDYVNAPIEDLASRFDSEDICVIHSDRELELSEMLRISGEEDSEDIPLVHDYLKLFSRIVPVSQLPRTAFISFHGADREAARRLVSALRADGIDVWLDERELKVGEHNNTVRKAIDKCTVFIPLISRNSEQFLTKDKNVQYHILEWEQASSANIKSGKAPMIIPVKIDDTGWTYNKFGDFYHLNIPGGDITGDYEKLKIELLKLQKANRNW